MTSTTIASSAQNAPTRPRVRHLYDERTATVARELGVQVRMLCGVWGWPTKGHETGWRELVASPSVDQCKRCTKVLSRMASGR